MQKASNTRYLLSNAKAVQPLLDYVDATGRFSVDKLYPDPKEVLVLAKSASGLSALNI